MGVDGYSGIMNNFFPELYAYLLRNWKNERQVTELLQSLLTSTSLIELAGYPINAKYTLNQRGASMNLLTRSLSNDLWTNLRQIETDSVNRLMDEAWKKIKKLSG